MRVRVSQVGDWQLARAAPDPRLAHVVRGYCGYAETTTAAARRREVPGLRVVVIFELGPGMRIVDDDGREVARTGAGFVVGLDDRASITESPGAQRGVQLDLTAAGARLFCGVPMHELAGRLVSIPDLLGAAGRELTERLADAPSWEAALARLEAAIAVRVAGAAPPDPRIAWAWRRLEESGGRASIGGLARELGMSHRLLIARFRDQLGMPPRQLARLLRFDRLCDRLRAGGPPRWAELAVDCGYYDQAHLARDVRALAGVTPTELVRHLLPA